MRRILVRFDDICPTMNYVQWKYAVDLLDKYNIKPLIGVIPDCKDPDLQIEAEHLDFWNNIKTLQEKGYTIAMHGYQHVFDSHNKGIVNNRYGSEFAGHSLEIQIEKIKKGKKILNEHGIYTDVFFAPAHSYDENTIKALAANGFKYMSDAKSSRPYEIDGLKLLPCRASGCPNVSKEGIYTVVFHAHEWEREDKKYCLKEFVKLLINYSNDIVSFDVFSSIESGSPFFQKIDEQAYLFWQYGIKPIVSKIYHIIIK